MIYHLRAFWATPVFAVQNIAGFSVATCSRIWAFVVAAAVRGCEVAVAVIGSDL
ncbi:MAG: hypothetical protein R3C26_19360 [Calditrichia bacterium]